MEVRKAVEADFPDIVRMGLEFAIAPGYEGRVNLDPLIFAERLEHLSQAEDGFLSVLTDDGKVCGAIGGFVAPSLFSNARHASELFWFVDPKARGNGSGRKLLEALVEWAKSTDALTLNMIEPPSNPQIGSLYEKMSFSKFETYWNISCH